MSGRTRDVWLTRQETVGFGLTIDAAENVSAPVFAVNVVPDGPAARLGLQDGQRIVAINGVGTLTATRQEVMMLIEGRPTIQLRLEDPNSSSVEAAGPFVQPPPLPDRSPRRSFAEQQQNTPSPASKSRLRSANSEVRRLKAQLQHREKELETCRVILSEHESIVADQQRRLERKQQSLRRAREQAARSTQTMPLQRRTVKTLGTVLTYANRISDSVMSLLQTEGSSLTREPSIRSVRPPVPSFEPSKKVLHVNVSRPGHASAPPMTFMIVGDTMAFGDPRYGQVQFQIPVRHVSRFAYTPQYGFCLEVGSVNAELRGLYSLRGEDAGVAFQLFQRSVARLSEDIVTTL